MIIYEWKKNFISFLPILYLGVILEDSSPSREAAFRKAIFTASERLNRASRSATQPITLNLITKNIKAGDAFAAATAGLSLYLFSSSSMIGK